MSTTQSPPRPGSRSSSTRDSATRPVDGAAERDRPRIQLTFVQVIASALAAVTATVAASFLGVAGTVIGAAIASVCTVVGNAVYGHSLARTRDRVRAVVPMPALRPAHTTVALARPSQPTAAVRDAGGWGEATEVISRAADEDVAWSTARTVGTPRRRPGTLRRRYLALALTVAGIFVGLLVAITGVELATGTPISDLLRGKDASGTTVLGTHEQKGGGSGSTPATTPTTASTGSGTKKATTGTGATGGSGRTTSTTTVTVTPSSGATSPTSSPTPGASGTGTASGSAPTSGAGTRGATSGAAGAGEQSGAAAG